MLQNVASGHVRDVIPTAIAGVVLLSILIPISNLRKNIAKAKKTGLPYVISPNFGLNNVPFMVGIESMLKLLRKAPVTKEWDWVKLSDRRSSWLYPRAAEEKYGDTYLVVSPFLCSLRTSNAELINQITTRRNDFTKPLARLRAADIFGRSILTSEGDDWKLHKRIIAPGFSEKSNKFVFEEALKQAESMLNYWAVQKDSSEQEMRVENASKDANTLSLHIICSAGFGAPQKWPNEAENSLGGKQVSGFDMDKSINDHTMSFKVALATMMSQLLYLFLFPAWFLRTSLGQRITNAQNAYEETNKYFEELLDYQTKKLELGEKEGGDADLMGAMIKSLKEGAGYGDKTNKGLSKSAVLGNSFLLLFAGHETTANSLHYSLLFLAISLSDQRKVQADIDNIVGRERPISEFSYLTHMPRLYNSMVGAVLNEQMRLIPAIPGVGKTTSGDQAVHVDGHEFTILDNTAINLNIIGVNRNPRYWQSVTSSHSDLNDFVPERWLPAQNSKEADSTEKSNASKVKIDGLENASFETSSSTSLLKPIKGSFLTFSDGPRACPGRRFAQVELTAALTAIFQRYSVELDVSEWASDERVELMTEGEKRVVYGKAVERARGLIKSSEQSVTFQLKRGEKVPLRFVERGRERFGCVD